MNYGLLFIKIVETPTVSPSATTKYTPALSFVIISIGILAFFNTFAPSYKQLHNE